MSYQPKPPESFWLRRLICHPMFPPISILASLVIIAANQWAHL